MTPPKFSHTLQDIDDTKIRFIADYFSIEYHNAVQERLIITVTEIS